MNNGWQLVDVQHRKFFQYTGWMLMGTGIALAITGVMFMRASARETDT